MLSQPHRLHHVVDDLPLVLRSRALRQAEPCRVVERTLDRQRVVEDVALGHVADGAPHRVEVPVEVEIIDENGAAGRRAEPVEGVHQRRLAAAGRPHEADELLGENGERHVVEHGLFAVGLRYSGSRQAARAEVVARYLPAVHPQQEPAEGDEVGRGEGPGPADGFSVDEGPVQAPGVREAGLARRVVDPGVVARDARSMENDVVVGSAADPQHDRAGRRLDPGRRAGRRLGHPAQVSRDDFTGTKAEPGRRSDVRLLERAPFTVEQHERPVGASAVGNAQASIGELLDVGMLSRHAGIVQPHVARRATPDDQHHLCPVHVVTGRDAPLISCASLPRRLRGCQGGAGPTGRRPPA